jgi:hypothetical protein
MLSADRACRGLRDQTRSDASWAFRSAGCRGGRWQLLARGVCHGAEAHGAERFVVGNAIRHECRVCNLRFSPDVERPWGFVRSRVRIRGRAEFE